MIKTDREYKGALNRLKEEDARIEATRKELEGMKMSPAEIQRALEPLQSFKAEVQQEIKFYERLKKGGVQAAVDLRDLGRTLIALRIAKGLSQSDLAKKLGAHVTQVSRDERNDYHGVTLDRASKVLEALGVQMVVAPHGKHPAPHAVKHKSERHQHPRRRELAFAT